MNNRPIPLQYVDMYEGRGVYLYSDGTYRHDPTDFHLLRCKYCDAFTSYTGTKQCDNCYEVSSRVRNIPADVLDKILADVRGFR